LTDREFCTAEHRRKGPLAASSELREYDGSGIYLESEAQREQRTSAVSGAALGLILLIGAALLVAARMWMPDSAPETVASIQVTNTSLDAIGPRAPVAANKFVDWVEKRLPGEQPLRIQWSVRSGLNEWTDSFGGRSWQNAGTGLNPGSLRLWRPTLDRRNYDLSFTGVIQKKAINFAYRANGDNYYATKLKLNRSGQVSGASIARLVFSGGKLIDEIELPLPVLLKTGHPYQIHVSATENMFATYLDGHLIDEWHDDRLKRGGVGFFSDNGEDAKVSDIAFRERKGLLSRFFATFFYMPTPLM
jgi:hypothetical protein